MLAAWALGAARTVKGDPPLRCWVSRSRFSPSLAARMLVHVEENASLGLDAVIDLHDGGTGSTFGYNRVATADALGPFLTEARRRGYTFFTVPT